MARIYRVEYEINYLNGSNELLEVELEVVDGHNVNEVIYAFFDKIEYNDDVDYVEFISKEEL